MPRRLRREGRPVILLAAIRAGRISVCDDRCWRATDPRCVCLCMGLCHGVGPEEAARRIAALDLATLAGAVAMPTLPLGAAESPVTASAVLEAAVEPLRVLRVPARPRVPREVGCSDCGAPWSEVVLVAMVDAGWLCDACATRLWRAS